MTVDGDVPPQPPHEPREVELKLEVDPENWQLVSEHPLLKEKISSPRQSQSVYFDTRKQALTNAGISLRVRRTGKKFVQTVKSDARSSAGLFDRSEWEAEVSGPEPDIRLAGESAPAILSQAADKGLVPVFETHIERRTCAFDWKESRIELMLDQGEVVAKERREPLAEVEMELIGGEPEALFDLARSMLPAVPMRIGVLTKAERGARLAAGQAVRATKAEPVALAPEMTVGGAFRAVGLACIRHFRLNEPLVLSARDSDALHQSRVALRRLRSAFSLFKPILGGANGERFRAELRTVAATLGEARNLDVLLKRRGDQFDHDLREQLIGAREQSYDVATAALNSAEIRQLMIDLLEWLALTKFASKGTPADDPILPFADAVLDRFWKRVRRDARQLTKVDDERRHELRIAGKKLRYATEFFVELHKTKKRRGGRERFLGALETLQDLLGDLNDVATEKELAGQLASRGIILPTADGSRSDERSRLLPRAEKAWLSLERAGPYWR